LICGDLARDLEKRFKSTGQLNDLDEATALRRELRISNGTCCLIGAPRRQTERRARGGGVRARGRETAVEAERALGGRDALDALGADERKVGGG
jgi:hypothetical protein